MLRVRGPTTSKGRAHSALLGLSPPPLLPSGAGHRWTPDPNLPRPRLCESNTTVPKFGGNNIHWLSDKRGGCFVKGKVGHDSKSCGNNTNCCTDKCVALAKGGWGMANRLLSSCTFMACSAVSKEEDRRPALHQHHHRHPPNSERS